LSSPDPARPPAICCHLELWQLSTSHSMFTRLDRSVSHEYPVRGACTPTYLVVFRASAHHHKSRPLSFALPIGMACMLRVLGFHTVVFGARCSQYKFGIVGGCCTIIWIAVQQSTTSQYHCILMSDGSRPHLSYTSQLSTHPNIVSLELTRSVFLKPYSQ
jgi:hypothetical protein